MKIERGKILRERKKEREIRNGKGKVNKRERRQEKREREKAIVPQKNTRENGISISSFASFFQSKSLPFPVTFQYKFFRFLNLSFKHFLSLWSLCPFLFLSLSLSQLFSQFLLPFFSSFSSFPIQLVLLKLRRCPFWLGVVVQCASWSRSVVQVRLCVFVVCSSVATTVVAVLCFALCVLVVFSFSLLPRLLCLPPNSGIPPLYPSALGFWRWNRKGYKKVSSVRARKTRLFPHSLRNSFSSHYNIKLSFLPSEFGRYLHTHNLSDWRQQQQHLRLNPSFFWEIFSPSLSLSLLFVIAWFIYFLYILENIFKNIS